MCDTTVTPLPIVGNATSRKRLDFKKIGGAPRRTRTLDLRLRRPLLYPAELLAHCWGKFGKAACEKSAGQSEKGLSPWGSPAASGYYRISIYTSTRQ